MRAALSVVLTMGLASPAIAAGCDLPEQGAGRVLDVIDARTVRLSDDAEIRLAGIAPLRSAEATAALAARVVGRDVTLRGDSDSPDRYGRQTAFIFLDADAPSLQVQLLTAGAALASGTIADPACARELAAAEAEARRAKRGLWAAAGVIKNAAIPDHILAELGRFVVAEGRVVSVREAGATTYLNFGRRWTRDFAVTISRRMMSAFAGAGIALKSLERRRVRVRGWVESRGSPRIELRHLGQIEVVGDAMTAGRE